MFDPNTREADSTQREVYTPTRLNREARACLEGSFPLLWVQGEVSNLARPASGHLYFTLKDEKAQVRCCLFRTWARYLRFQLRDGDEVILRARISLYEARGEFQLIAEHAEPAGEGALQAQFERLKAELDRAGLFALAHKKPLPRFPGRIGVITSASGAALHDVLTVLRRRYPIAPVRVFSVAVQGAQAAPAICKALQMAARQADCDVLILTRGGGSLEDLWAFNEKSVAQSIFDCPIPVISAVGHEVDTTIADLVADMRAPTPSAAAEIAAPDGKELAREFAGFYQRVGQLFQRALREQIQNFDRTAARLLRQRPDLRLAASEARLIQARRGVLRCMAHHLALRHNRLQGATARLRGLRPERRLRELSERRAGVHGRLAAAMQRCISGQLQTLAGHHRALVAVSPEATLGRGYAIVQLRDGQVVRSSSQAPPGTLISTTLAHGKLQAEVKQCEED